MCRIRIKKHSTVADAMGGSTTVILPGLLDGPTGRVTTTGATMMTMIISTHGMTLADKDPASMETC